MMHSKRWLLLILLITGNASGQSSNEIALVKKCFSDYKQSILEGRGRDAAKTVDTKTLKYYEKIVDLSIHADSVTIINSDLLDKLTILLVRHRIPKEELFKMNGVDFFVYAIDKGMIGKNSVLSTELGDVKVAGNFANGQVVANGQAAPLFFQFNKENNEWKIDITSIFPPTNMALSKMLEDQGLTDLEFIFQSLEGITGRKASNDIWKPLK